jgi:hypothetical protein
MFCDRCAENGTLTGMAGVVFSVPENHVLVYRCINPECGRMYDKTDGYYSMLDDQRSEQNCSLCTGCHTARQLGRPQG